MRRPGQIGALTEIRAGAPTHEWHCDAYSERWKILRPAREPTPPSADGGACENYCCPGLQLHRRPRLRSGLRRRKRRHGLTRRFGNRQWRITRCRRCLPQVLLGGAGDRARYLFLVRLELFGGPGIFAGQFFLAGLELLDLLLHACEITRHRLEQLCLLGWDRGGCRILRCGLSRRWQLRNCCVRRSHLNSRRALLVGELRCFRRQRRSRSQLRCPPGDHLPGRLAIGLRSESSDTDARCQQQGDQAAQRRPATRRPTKPVRGLLRPASVKSVHDARSVHPRGRSVHKRARAVHRRARPARCLAWTVPD